MMRWHRLALAGWIAFAGPALAAGPLEDGAARVAAKLQPLLPVAMGSKTVITGVLAAGAKLSLQVAVDFDEREFEAGQGDLRKAFCSAPGELTDFVAAGGVVEWTARLADGKNRTVLLTAGDCKPQPLRRATRSELQRTVERLGATLPIAMRDGAVLRSVRLGEGLELVYVYDAGKVVPPDKARRIAANEEAKRKLTQSIRGRCEDPSIRIRLQQGVTVVHQYEVEGYRFFEAHMTPAFCDPSLIFSRSPSPYPATTSPLAGRP